MLWMNLTRAQRVYNQQAATIEENEASKNLLTRDLQREVMLKQKGYAWGCSCY